jgi:hypothetical protein
LLSPLFRNGGGIECQINPAADRKSLGTEGLIFSVNSK